MERNTQEALVKYVQSYPFESENQILEGLYDFYRGHEWKSNKKYAELIRRALTAGKIARVEAKVKGNKSKFYYYIPR